MNIRTSISLFLFLSLLFRVEAQDTSLVISEIERANQVLDLFQLDSAAAISATNLARVDSLLSKAKDPKMIKNLSRLKADVLVQVGRAEHDVNIVWPFDQAVEIYQKIGDKSGEAEAYIERSGRAEDMGQYYNAIQYLRKAVGLMEQTNDELAVARPMNTIGVYYRIMDNPTTALEYHLEALPIIEEKGTNSQVGWCNILLGAVYRTIGDGQTAKTYFKRAHDLFLTTDDSIRIGIAYNDLGTAYQIAQENDSALYWHRKAAALRERIGSLDGLGHSMQYIGEIHRDQKEFDEAIRCFNIAIDSYGKVPMPGSMGKCYSHIAAIYFETNRQDTAISVMKSAVDLVGRFEEKEFYPFLTYRLGKMLTELGRYEEANEVIDWGIQEATLQGNHLDKSQGLKDQYENFLLLNDYRNAYLKHQEYMVTYDSSDHRLRNSTVLQMMLKYETEQLKLKEQNRDRSARNTQQAKLDESKRQQYAYIAGGSLLAFLALGLVGRIRFSAQTKNQLEKQRIALKQAKIRAEQSEKFKERFLANMSHEIRTPMNAITGMSVILKRNEHLPEQEVYLEGVSQNAHHLLHIINDILDLSKIDAGKLDLEAMPFSMERVIKEVIEENKEEAELKSLEITGSFNGPLPETLIGDELRIKQVLSNLVRNAVKFTENGSVRVNVMVEEATEDRSTLAILVKDTGSGIPADRVDTIFEEFNKAYTEGTIKYGGSGLGLTLGKRLIEMMNGTIEVDSKEGVGTRFTIVIPFEKPSASAQIHAVEQDAVELKDLRILLTDDNEFNVMVAQDELMDAIPGVKIDLASNGKEAIDKVYAGQYDLVLMDIQMPEMNGYDATKAIRGMDEPKRSIPVLAMTANGVESEVKRCMEAGMDGFVPKPFKRVELTSAIKKVLNRSEI